MNYQTILKLICGLCIFGICSSIQAQEQNKVRARYVQQDMLSILHSLGEKTPYTFYFKSEDLPTNPISISFEGENIEQVCKRLFAQTDLTYILYKKYGVIIAPKTSFDPGRKSVSTFSEEIASDSLASIAAADYYQLEEVTISGSADNSRESLAGSIRLDPVQLELIPLFMGEADLMKGILFQAGISSIGEGATGFHVRGGNNDENLILLGENSLLNANHAFGFFSAINTHLIQEVNLYKGAIPAQFGGRLSSVMDIQLKQANTERPSLEGSLGPISARFTAEIPMIKGKSSLMLGGRSLFSDWILQQIEIPELQSSSMFFYDLNANYLHYLNEKNILSAEFYSSKDDFQFANTQGFNYRSLAGSLKLTQILQNKWVSDLSLSYNAYASERENLDINLQSAYRTEIEQYKLKEKLQFRSSENLDWDLGASFIYYTSSPGESYKLSSQSPSIPFSKDPAQGVEANVFLNLNWTPGQRWKFLAGLRYSSFQALGSAEEYLYENPENPRFDQISGRLSYEHLERIITYTTPEPRLAVNYQIDPTHSLKAAFSRTAQYIFQLSSFDAAIPTDAWILSSRYLRPQRASNYSLEWSSLWPGSRWRSNTAVYFRTMTDLKDYVDFADLFSPNPIETEILHAEGRAYGWENQIEYNQEPLNFSLSYTLSRSERRTGDEVQERSINNGTWYLSNFDKSHEINLFLNYQFNRRHRFALSFNFASGRPFTAPIGFFDIDGQSRTPIYTGRNQFRIADYHRLDISYTFGKSLKREKSWKGSWTLGIYNLYGRRNAYSIFFTQARFGEPKANRLSILGSAFPSVTYNFSWKK